MHDNKLAPPSDRIADHVSFMEPAETVKDLLGEHVPLSLIMDLAEPGPGQPADPRTPRAPRRAGLVDAA